MSSVPSSSDLVISTARLDLAPLSADAIDAWIQRDGARLVALTGARFPDPAAPPPYMAESLSPVRERLRDHPGEAAWWTWLLVRRADRSAVGSVAFGGLPDPSGAVLIGYAMYPGHEGKGYASEAVRALVEWAFSQPGVQVVRALAPVWNTPAVHVAEKVGMRPVASDEDDEVGEVLVYEIRREPAASA